MIKSKSPSNTKMTTRQTWVYYNGDVTKPCMCICLDPESARHNDNRDPETGCLLPAFRQWDKDGVLRQVYWMRNGRGHNADRDRETGEPLPSWIYENGEKYWSIYTMEKTAARPDDPYFLEHLAAWEREHGVHGSPTVKSAQKQ